MEMDVLAEIVNFSKTVEFTLHRQTNKNDHIFSYNFWLNKIIYILVSGYLNNVLG